MTLLHRTRVAASIAASCLLAAAHAATPRRLIATGERVSDGETKTAGAP